MYRALMLASLERAYTPTYRHAAKDWQGLRELAELCPDPAPLVSPAEFEAAVRQRHGKKLGFWGLVG